MPRIDRILETAIHVDDMERAVGFYERVVGLAVMSRGDRLTALDAGEGTVLLVFARGGTARGVDTPSGRIPPHDARGSTHFAFAVPAAEVEAWRRHLGEHGVDIESEVRWQRGGTSLYFRDPDGHSVELAAPGVWPTY